MKKNIPPLQRKSSRHTLLKTVGSLSVVAGLGLVGAGMMLGGSAGGAMEVAAEEETFRSLLTRPEKGLAKHISPERLQKTEQLLTRLENDGILGILSFKGGLKSLSRIASEHQHQEDFFYNQQYGEGRRILLNRNLQRLRNGLSTSIRETTFRFLQDTPLTSQENAIFDDIVTRACTRESDMSKILTPIKISGHNQFTLYDLFREDRPEQLARRFPQDKEFSTYMVKGYRQNIRRALIQNDNEFYTLLNAAYRQSKNLVLNQTLYEKAFIRPFYEEVISLLEEIERSDIEGKKQIVQRLVKMLKQKDRELTTFSQFEKAMMTDLDRHEYHRDLFSVDQTRHSFFNISTFESLKPLFRGRISQDALYIPSS
jgi:hypothetical protein